jgi:dolichyl-phosphate beta-glucosyltransferase
MSWSLVVPMWQEAARIEATIEQLAASKLAHADVERIFVDDGSDDGTAERCEAALARHGLDARVLRLPDNIGKGGAVRRGVLAARGEVIGFSDADLSCGPDDIVAVFEVVADGRADVAIASRTDPDTVIAAAQPFGRRWSGWLFNVELRMLGLTDLHDTQCGLKAFSAPAARALFEPMRTSRYAFDIEVLATAQRWGYTIAEVPVHWQHVEASRVSPLRDGGRMVLDALAIRSRRVWRSGRPA